VWIRTDLRVRSCAMIDAYRWFPEPGTRTDPEVHLGFVVSYDPSEPHCSLDSDSDLDVDMISVHLILGGK
jgi:hypothetical protein